MREDIQTGVIAFLRNYSQQSKSNGVLYRLISPFTKT